MPPLIHPRFLSGQLGARPELSPALPLLRAPCRQGSRNIVGETAVVSYEEYRLARWRDAIIPWRAALRLRRTWPKREGTVALSLFIRPERRAIGWLSVWCCDSAAPLGAPIARSEFPVESRSAQWQMELSAPLDLVGLYAEAESRLRRDHQA